jgi:glyoxylase-like metal-dependent hydrolase (beta-lactamase superfamily II)
MWRSLVFTVALALGATLVQPAAAQSGADLVKQSVAAQGGAAAINSPKTTIIKGEAKHWEPGQSYSPTGEAKFLGDSTYTQTVDNTSRTVRIDWDRDMKYPAVERLKFSEITTPNFGVVVDDKGVQTPMSGIRLAAHWRERERASPRLLVRALDDPQSIAALPDQQIGDRSLPAVSIKTRAGTFAVLFDRATHLPAVIRTRDVDNVYGDSNYDLFLSDWKDVGGGAKRAHTLSFQLNGVEVQRLTLKQVALDAPIPPDTFVVSDEVKAKAKTAASEVPYQWVLRRMFLGRFLDSDKVYFPENGGFRLAELAPNVQHVVGGSANNLIVAMKDGIVIFDAPVDSGQSRWVIDAAKAKYPGKPVKQLVLTHHHMDHSGGTRAYVAEGAEIVIPGQARPFVEKMIQAEHKLSPDALAREPKQAKIVDVKDTMSLKDDTVEINLYNIPNPHSDGMIIGHVVGPNLVWVTDLISPRGPIARSPNTVAVGDALRKTGITEATIVGGHGRQAGGDCPRPGGKLKRNRLERNRAISLQVLAWHGPPSIMLRIIREPGGSRPLRQDENPLDAARRLLRERAGFTAPISYPRLFNLA